MKKQLMIALLSIAPALGVVAQDKLYKDEFPLGDITLLDGPLKHARDLNVQVLLKYDCDRMLAPYRKEAGLQPRKPSYPNWDGLDGHVGGHYLSALAINAATGNEECRKRMEYMISELQLVLDANNQRPEAWCHNYIGGVPNSAKMWTAFSKGDFGPCFGTWAPFYNIHKMVPRCGRLSVRAISDLALEHGHLSIIFIRCMQVFVMHGSISAMNRQRISF